MSVLYPSATAAIPRGATQVAYPDVFTEAVFDGMSQSSPARL